MSSHAVVEPPLTQAQIRALTFLSKVDMGHRGDTHESTFRSLNRRGLIEFACWGADADLQIDDDVALYRITEYGRAVIAVYLHEERKAVR